MYLNAVAKVEVVAYGIYRRVHTTIVLASVHGALDAIIARQRCAADAAQRRGARLAKEKKKKKKKGKNEHTKKNP